MCGWTTSASSTVSKGPGLNSRSGTGFINWLAGATRPGMLRPVMGRARSNRVVASCFVLGMASCNTYDDGLLVGSLAPSVPEGGASASGSGNLPVTEGDAGAGAAAGDADSGSGGSAGDEPGPEAADAGTGGELAEAGSSSVGGSTSVAGSSGAGGGAAPTLELLDDFEDQDGFVLPLHKRNGPWYVFSDMTKSGTLSPFTVALVSGAASHPGSSSALHLMAKGFTDWGAGVGADLVNLAGKKVAYDVSAYSGIQFYAKVGSGAQSSLKLLVTTTYSDAAGGKCSDAAADRRCSDHLFCTVSGLGSAWGEYRCDFAELVQQGFGLPQAGLDPSSVYSVQFTLSTKLLPADLWIDDVSFVRR